MIIVRVELNDNTTFMTDEASTILYDNLHGKEMITICLIGRSVSFDLDAIKVLRIYPNPTTD